MTVRITLALLVIVPAALAYPWHTITQRVALGVAVAVLLVVFAWWRGLFVTTMVRRRVAIWRRNRSTGTARSGHRVTVVLSIEDPVRLGLPLPTIAGYVDRYGVRCDTVRVTSHEAGARRTTWISVTVDALDNLAALAAREKDLPLADTAEIVARRLADQLRELGLEAAIVDAAEAPLTERGRETWTALRDAHGAVTAFGLPIDERLAARLDAVWAQPDTWTVLEFSGTSAHPMIAAACAFRTQEPLASAPVPGLVARRGVQRPALGALDPRSVDRIGGAPAPLPPGSLQHLAWPVESVDPTLSEQTRL